MSIAGRNALKGSTMNVFRSTTGDDTVTWANVYTDIKLELLPITVEVAREVFGSGVNVELMAMTSLDIRAQDGLVVTAGTFSGIRFRVASALLFHKFTQLGLQSTGEAIG